MTNTLPDTQQAFTVNLRDLVVPLGYSDITHLRGRFETFKTKLAKSKDHDFSASYKVCTYFDETTKRFVDTYTMSKTCAAKFALYARPALLSTAIETATFTKVLEAINDMDTDDLTEDRTKFVYAAADDTGRIKVGISIDPAKRVKQLSAGNASSLRLVYVRQADKPKYASEVEAHRALAEYQIRSEWFEPDALEVLHRKFPMDDNQKLSSDRLQKLLK